MTTARTHTSLDLSRFDRDTDTGNWWKSFLLGSPTMRKEWVRHLSQQASDADQHKLMGIEDG